jgi:hypothetical protein
MAGSQPAMRQGGQTDRYLEASDLVVEQRVAALHLV